VPQDVEVARRLEPCEPLSALHPAPENLRRQLCPVVLHEHAGTAEVTQGRERSREVRGHRDDASLAAPSAYRRRRATPDARL
jgi:hypothetical protein